jgi:hypothetical protein
LPLIRLSPLPTGDNPRFLLIIGLLEQHCLPGGGVGVQITRIAASSALVRFALAVALALAFAVALRSAGDGFGIKNAVTADMMACSYGGLTGGSGAGVEMVDGVSWLRGCIPSLAFSIARAIVC